VRVLFSAVVVVVGLGACGPTDKTPVPPPEAWALRWADEFDGAAGSSPDPTKWVLETGRGPNNDGWGNNELQTYTARPENVSLDGEGHLVITAQREAFEGQPYTASPRRASCLSAAAASRRPCAPSRARGFGRVLDAGRQHREQLRGLRCSAAG
jgi:hypothetical protein